MITFNLKVAKKTTIIQTTIITMVSEINFIPN